MSYSKRMMTAAAEWIAANPDPADPLLRIPRGVKFGETMRADREHAKEILSRWEHDPRVTPDQLAEMRTSLIKVNEVDDRLADGYRDLEGVLNRPWEDQRGKIIELQVDAIDVLGRWLVRWARSGHNTFDLSPDFTAAMLLTDHRDLAINEIRMPFPALLITIPDSFARGPEGRHYTKIHVIETSKREHKELTAATQIVGAVKDLSPTDRDRVLADAMRGAHVSLAPGVSIVRKGETQVAITIDSKLVTSADDDERSLFIYASDGTHGLYTAVDLAGLTWDKLEELPTDNLTPDETDAEVQRTIWRIVFGMLTYVTAIDNAIEPRLAAPPHKAKDGKPRVRHWDVGRTIKIAPELVRTARAGAREIAFKIKSRFMVRGQETPG